MRSRVLLVLSTIFLLASCSFGRNSGSVPKPKLRFKAVAFDYFVIFDPNSIIQKDKPDPRAYELGMKHLHLKKSEIVFAAFGGWDAYGAKSFGYTTCRVNRLHLPAEGLGMTTDMVSNEMDGLVEFVLGNADE